MKSDEFEKFVRSNRQLFDDIEPAPPQAGKVLGGEKKNYKIKMQHMLFAASLLIIAVLSFLLIFRNDRKPQDGGLSINKRVLEVNHINDLNIAEVAADTIPGAAVPEKKIVTKPSANKPHKAVENNETYGNTELAEASKYYNTQIKSRRDELFILTSDSPQLYKLITADIDELENAYKDLNKDLADNIDNQQVIEAMVQNYRLRLTILEDILYQLKKQQNVETTKNNGYEF